MTPDDTLSAFFAEAAPPVRDLGFQAVVAERIARRRAIATVGAMVPWTIAAVALCWALAPMLGPVVDALGQALIPAAGILGLTLLAVMTALWTGQRLRTI
ncbi:MAG: hypothetical protein V4701_11640 [Pseudomonadota bacterium]